MVSYDPPRHESSKRPVDGSTLVTAVVICFRLQFRVRRRSVRHSVYSSESSSPSVRNWKSVLVTTTDIKVTVQGSAGRFVGRDEAGESRGEWVSTW